ncbi:MAG: hypothetical protein JNN07_26390 [Verrucomicrobiales bacterium]|nr:hypothetical protein [Verrucomicrobiales bacterium]
MIFSRLGCFCVALYLGLTGLVNAAEAPASFKVGEFEFKRPEKWSWVEPTSPMRKATLKVASADGKDSAEVVFFHFGPGNGGGTQANVDRWLGQFQEGREKIQAKVEESKVGGRSVTFVQAQGTYLSGMPGGPKTALAGTMLKGAIVESSEGSVFIRMTGPVAFVSGLDAAFRGMVESPLKK